MSPHVDAEILTRFHLSATMPIGRYELVGDSVCFTQDESIGTIYDRQPKPSRWAWGQRRDFLAIPLGDGRSLLTFLNRTGVWEEGTHKWDIHEFWQDQELMRRLLTRTPWPLWTGSRDRWVEDALQSVLTDSMYLSSVSFSTRSVPALELNVPETRAALFLTIWLDLRGSVKFKYCARKDCPDHAVGKVPFALTSDHERKYCGPECAHVMAVRKHRKRSRHNKRGR